MRQHRLTVLRIVLTALSIGTVCFIFYQSSLNADASTENSDAVMGGLNGLLRALGLDLVLSDHTIRKMAHFAEYFVLGGLISLTAYSYVRQLPRMLLIALPAGAAAAVCDELIQLGSAGRSCEIKDMALDFSAVLAASLLVTLILYLIRRYKTKKAEKQKAGNQSE